MVLEVAADPELGSAGATFSPDPAAMEMPVVTED
jgi:hypothetical protein